MLIVSYSGSPIHDEFVYHSGYLQKSGGGGVARIWTLSMISDEIV